MIFLKPIDEALLEVIADKHQNIITIEDGTVKGGLASTVKDWLNNHDRKNHVTSLGINDIWVHHGSVEELRTDCGYDYESIVSTIKRLVEAK